MKSLRMLYIYAVIGLLFAASAAAQSESVSIVTADGVVLSGTLYKASASGAPAVICLHQWRSDRSSYSALAAELHKAGYNVLTIDARGYGGSTKTEAGKRVRPDRDIQQDVAAAVKYMKDMGGSKIGLIGASYGSSNAVIFASKASEISSLVLLSPGLNYFNQLPTEGPVAKLKGRAVFAAASKEDVRSLEAVNRYKEILGADIDVKIYDAAGHGTDMFDAEPGLKDAIKSFLDARLR
ncbi:MAG: hypothetical protein CL946_12385 [Ectothiorhodospiraceae bacterium]|nr:hypothetical protein [Ectothiorhodospiraceae bacterium]